MTETGTPIGPGFFIFFQDVNSGVRYSPESARRPYEEPEKPDDLAIIMAILLS